MGPAWRLAETADVAQLAEWNHQLIRDEGHRNRMTVPELEARLRGWLRGEYRAVIFSQAADPVGYALYRPQPDEIYLRQFFIHRDRRRQGLGRACFGRMREEIWPKDVRLTVEVLCRNNAAIAFWRSVGYADYFLGMEIMPPGTLGA